ncbi:MAG: thiamine-phosphate kinase [Candidatus Thermoplasmatota archaeon]|nr:thiamine-phosphate kinase [Candidatus Thermoplasmatota archaeon]
MSLPEERELIALLSDGVESVRNQVGLEDDAAIVPLGNTDLVLSVDSFAAATHFPDASPPELWGRLAVGAALSDLAACGADVLGVLVAYGLPACVEPDVARRIAAGVSSAITDHGGELLGGDTKPSREVTLSVTAVGQVPPGKALVRSKASAGDTLIVTGPLGGAGAALERWEQGRVEEAVWRALLDPSPRLRAGRVLREVGVRCAMDLSDGLADAAVAIAEASGVRTVIEEAAIPLHPWASAPEGVAWALSTGGDYELLAAVPASLQARAVEALERGGLSPRVVGAVEPGEGAALATNGGERPLSRGFQHRFASAPAQREGGGSPP